MRRCGSTGHEFLGAPRYLERPFGQERGTGIEEPHPPPRNEPRGSLSLGRPLPLEGQPLARGEKTPSPYCLSCRALSPGWNTTWTRLPASCTLGPQMKLRQPGCPWLDAVHERSLATHSVDAVSVFHANGTASMVPRELHGGRDTIITAYDDITVESFT